MIPTFKEKTELLDYLGENKNLLIVDKKSQFKKADAFSYIGESFTGKDGATKASLDTLLSSDSITAKIVVNTTRLMDSHDDVHINGMWNKTVQENKEILHLQEHRMDFKNVISDDVNAYIQSLAWKTIGFPYEGRTQALTFDSVIDKSRNPFMFEQYAKGYVKQHSVGMRYVNLFLAVNSDSSDWQEEKDIWDKYYDDIANKELADDKGYFWAVTEAKLIEGSAVVMGSNSATPTREVNPTKDNEPGNTTQKQEPGQATPSGKQFLSNLI